MKIPKIFFLSSNEFLYADTAHSNQEGSLNDISPELLQLILSLLSHDKYKKYGISELTHTKFVSQFSRDFPRERCPLILAPLIYSENTEIPADKMSANSQGILTSGIMDTSWANLVMDIGKTTFSKSNSFFLFKS